MAIGTLERDRLNGLWKDEFGNRRYTLPLLQFVWTLTPRLHENRGLKGGMLVASPDGLRLGVALAAVGSNELAVSITGKIGVPDILRAIPMPIESEALEFALFLARCHSEHGIAIPADIRADGENALRDFLIIASRDASPCH